MLFPLISFTTGLFLIILSTLIYQGNLPFNRPFLLANLSNNLFFLWGNILTSLAAMMGMIGYWNIIRGDDLRLGRIVLLILGLSVSTWAFLETVSEKNPLRKLQILVTSKSISYFLTGVSILALISIFLIAFFDYNYGGDAFMYHVPFAARLWGIIVPEQYIFEYFTENRFLGFPLLANWLQGLFWIIFHRIEATNLVAYSSLIILIIYLVKVAKIPFYLATLSLLAVPMVHMHAARSYIDLPGNVGISIYLFTLYLLYIKKIEINIKILIILFLSAFVAANVKLQLVPVIFLLLLFSLPFFIRHYWQVEKNLVQNSLKFFQLSLLGILAILIIFYNPIKNTLIYHNPVYPIKIAIAGHELNHTEGISNFMHPNIRKLPPPIRWGKSVLEINAFDKRRPWHWTLAMDFISLEEERFGMGGYLGGYVVVNLFLLVFLCWRDWQKETKTALLLVGLMTTITSWLPQSYELRYYMYWMIILVSLNAYLVCRFAEKFTSLYNPIKPHYFGLVALVFMINFMNKTGNFYIYPAFRSLSQQLQDGGMLDKNILNSIKEEEKICLIGKTPNTFFYNSYFHPPRQYSLKSEFLISEEFLKEKCENRRIIR